MKEEGSHSVRSSHAGVAAEAPALLVAGAHVKLLLSPIYAGTSSTAQRWRKATARKRIIIRDAVYRVPLFMTLMRVRPEEILQLKLKDVRRRDGLLCIFIGEDADDVVKADQSRRYLPIPQTILRLGFRDWVMAKLAQGETWAFPEVQPDASHGRRSQVFGDRLRTLFKRLDLLCPSEDIYAMRRTLASKLLNGGVDTGVRQRVLGHLEGTTVDRHYSDHGLRELKDVLDSVDYGIEVGRVRLFAFPTITGCKTPILPLLDVEIRLTNQGNLAAIRLSDPDTEIVAFEAHLADAPLPKNDEWQALPSLTAKQIADRILAMAEDHSLIMPANEEAVGALEHLLILGDTPAPRFAPAGRADAPVVLGENEETPRTPRLVGTSAALTADAGGLETVARGNLSRGDFVICALPLAGGNQAQNAAPRPALVIGSRSAGGKRYLDVAWGAPIEGDCAKPHEFVVIDPRDLAATKLTRPTKFNLRRRFLISVDDTCHLRGRLGRLSEKAAYRLTLSTQAAGDVAPVPLGEHPKAPSAPLFERRRRKVQSTR